MLTRHIFTAAFLVSSAIAAEPSAHATDFRVDNAIYSGGDEKPQSQGTTIFHNGLVYDFLTDPAEIIVFDKARSRFVLLDLTRKLRSELWIDDVKGIVERAKQRLAGHTNPQLRWLGEPTFDQTFDRDKSELTLRGEFMTYEAQLLPTGPDVASQYREFCDLYAQFNYAINPGSRPPFARMMLNDALDRNHGIAKEVHLTSNLASDDPSQKITSRHQLAAQLEASDKTRITEAQEDFKSFQRVSLKDYLQKK